jgi:hypothetical protein
MPGDVYIATVFRLTRNEQILVIAITVAFLAGAVIKRVRDNLPRQQQHVESK